MSNTARKVNRPRFIAKYNQERQRLYKLDSPVKYLKYYLTNPDYTEHSTSYVLCSNSIKGHCAPETMLFPANWRGKIKSFRDIGYAKCWNADKEVLSQIEVIIKKIYK
jgi:hypothetical protein